MKRLLAWWNAEPHSHVADPVIMDNVTPAEPPNRELADQTNIDRVEFIQALLALGRDHARLTTALAESALENVNHGAMGK
jgi:hypothetical protein